MVGDTHITYSAALKNSNEGRKPNLEPDTVMGGAITRGPDLRV